MTNLIRENSFELQLEGMNIKFTTLHERFLVLLSTLILWLLNFRIYNFDINPQLIKIFHTHLKKHTRLLTKGNQIYNIDYSFLKEHPLRKRHDMVVQGWWLGEFKLKKLFVQVSVIPIQYNTIYSNTLNQFKIQASYGSGEFTMVDSGGISNLKLNSSSKNLTLATTKTINWEIISSLLMIGLVSWLMRTHIKWTLISTRNKFDVWSSNTVSEKEKWVKWTSGLSVKMFI